MSTSSTDIAATANDITVQLQETNPPAVLQIRRIVEQKGPKLRQDLPDGEAWLFHYAVFARAGFTEAAAAELTGRQGLLVDLPALDAVLSA